MASTAVAKILSKLDGVKPLGSGWIARCPSHEDHVQSLKIDERSDGSALVHCHASCAKTDVLAAMGLTFADLFEPKTDAQTIVATYDYRALDGALLYQALRYIPKSFRQRRPDGSGGWIWNMVPYKNKKVPYRWPDLRGHATVIVCEGERDCNSLWDLGLPATTNIGGAGKWGASETKCLKAAGVQRVMILPDHDEAGARHAIQVAKLCRAAEMVVNVVELDGLPPHGDVSDWLSMGHTKADLESLMQAQLYAVPASGPVPQMGALPVQADAGDTSVEPATFDPLGYHLTHLGAADAFRDRCGTTIRYYYDKEKWLIWSGQYWKPDADEQVYRMAYGHIRQWAVEAVTVMPFEKRKEVQDFTRKLEKSGETSALIQTAKRLPPIYVSGEVWNPDPWLLGCPNGVVDLRTGVLRDGVPADMVTQQTGVAYDATAICPRWEQFMSEVFDGDTDLVTYVQRALGYSLTGDMREQCFFLAIGTGSNGKSLFLNLLESVFGTYGQRANMRIFVGAGDADKYHLADLAGARLIFASEVKADTYMNEHVMKAFTGGETIRAEHKYGHPFTFRPIGKIWLGVNHAPKVTDDSYGFWRRVRLIPFMRTFTGSADDRTLRDRLQAEAPGILAWVVRGALAWQAEGLPVPHSVVMATDEYQTAEDPMAEFFADRIICEPGAVTSFSAIFAAYAGWSEKQGIAKADRLTRRGMGMNLKRRFETADVEGVRKYKGLRVRDTSSLYAGDD